METNEGIDSALSVLSGLALGTDILPAVIRLSPDSDAYVLSNREGYIRLAIAALNAAQGRDQSFKDSSWVDTEEFDWGFSGLKYDPNAHTHLRPAPTRWGKFVGGALPLLLAVIGIVGLCTIGYGIVAIFR